MLAPPAESGRRRALALLAVSALALHAAPLRASPPAPPAGPTPADDTLPTYRTRLPPGATLRYDLRRGPYSGSGELRWQPAARRYELRLEGSVLGISVLTQLSRGTFDAAGLAPRRFTDQRFRRTMQAADFQREAGKVTFSGPAPELRLHPGVQDRLSWMIQLAAVVAAEPSLRGPGARVVLQVVGARGDAGLWVFRCVGAESLDTAAGRIAALRYLREPHGADDSGADVWLDPVRHFLPVRATTRRDADGDGLDLVLREALVGG